MRRLIGVVQAACLIAASARAATTRGSFDRPPVWRTALRELVARLLETPERR